MRRSRLLVAHALALLAAIPACGGGTSTGSSILPGVTTGGAAGAGGSSATSQGGASGSSAGGAMSVGGSGGSGGSLSVGGGCMPACDDATQSCSSSGKCIPKGTCMTSNDCTGGMMCDPTTMTCMPGSTCGSTKVGSDMVVANLLIVLDRSCSMTQKVGTTGMSKWQIAVAAIDQMTVTYQGKIRFGLTLFPDKDMPNCDQDATVPIPPGDGNETKIQDLLNASLMKTDPNFPSSPCVTPIDAGLHQASLDPSLMDPSHPTFLLLMTDGEQSSGCSAYGAAAGATTLIGDMQKAGTDTFVVGFGSGVNVMQLDAFATAGGKPATGMTQFYQAQDAASLGMALSTIAGQTLGCVFQLDGQPPDPAMLFVFFNGMEKVPNDPTNMNGWDYDPMKNQVTVYGSYCDALKGGMVSKVDVVYGCDMLPPG